jgi:5-methylcytosine-specific restriction endonuclease McrA
MEFQMKVDWTDHGLLRLVVGSCTSFAEVFLRLGITHNASNLFTLKKYLTKYHIPTGHLIAHKKHQQHPRNVLTNDELFVEQSSAPRVVVKRRVLDQQLIEYKCAHCNNGGFWNNNKLTLQLEHINGVNNDHRLDNLCFLCPNCHSQTTTYAGRNVQHKVSKRQTWDSWTNARRIRNQTKNQPLIDRVNQSGIDFTQWGWAAKVAVLIDKKPAQVARWMRTYMPSKYQAARHAVKK